MMVRCGALWIDKKGIVGGWKGTRIELAGRRAEESFVVLQGDLFEVGPQVFGAPRRAEAGPMSQRRFAKALLLGECISLMLFISPLAPRIFE